MTKTRGRLYAMAGLLLSIMADPIFISSFVKHSFVAADMWKF